MVRVVVGIAMFSPTPSAGALQFDHFDVNLTWTFQDDVMPFATTLGGPVTIPNGASREEANTAIATAVRAATLAAFTTGPYVGSGPSGVIDELDIPQPLEMKRY